MERSEAVQRLTEFAGWQQQMARPDFKMAPPTFNRLLDLLHEYDLLQSAIEGLRRENRGLRETIDSGAVAEYVRKLENVNQELLNEIATWKHNLRQRADALASLIEQSLVKDKDIKTLIRANDNYGMVIQQRDREIADKLQRITELSGLNGRLCREKAELQKRNDSQANTIRDYQQETGRWESPSKDEVIDELRNLALKMGIEAGEKDLVILDLTKRLERAEKSLEVEKLNSRSPSNMDIISYQEEKNRELRKTYSLLEEDYEARWAELVEAQAELAQLRRERNETPVNRIDRLEKIMRESLAEIKEHRRQTR
jgi:hypothetical protein